MFQIDPVSEAEFALRKRHPERTTIYQRHASLGSAYRAVSNGEFDLRYAPGDRCLLDVFPAKDEDAPVLFFVHGGYWRALDKDLVSFIAKPFQAAGITVVMPGYDLAPTVAVPEIVDEIRAAFRWTLDRLAPRQVVVSGHSAGAQLAAMIAMDQAEQGSGPIVGFAGVSGVFDLRNLLTTSINEDLHLTPSSAALASPTLRATSVDLKSPLVPMVSLIGGEETDGFKGWSADLVDVWAERGGQSSLVEVPGATHFSILDQLAAPDSLAHFAIRDLFPDLTLRPAVEIAGAAATKGTSPC